MEEKNDIKQNEKNVNEIMDAFENVEDIARKDAMKETSFQTKLIKIFLEDSEFEHQITDIIKSKYFDNIHHRLLFEHIIKYINKYNVTPTYDTLRSLISYKEKGLQREHLVELVDIISNYKHNDKAYVADVSLEFCRKQSLKDGLFKAAKAWGREDYDSISVIISDSLKLGEPKSSGHNYLMDVEKRLVAEKRNPVTAMEGLDSIIGGGLSGGELGILLAPTGGGKSMGLVKFAANAIMDGKKAVYYSLEMKEERIGQRFDAALNKIPLKYVAEYVDVIRETSQHIKNKGGELFIKEFPTGTATVNTLRAHLQTLERDFGIIPDVMFVDYADIMKSTADYAERRYNLTSIYESLRALAMELNIPIWTATQANRDAINSPRFDLKVISESLGKAQTADVILGIARPEEDKLVKRGKMMILKNRNGEDGFAIDMHFDTSNLDIRVLQDVNQNNTGIANIAGLDIQTLTKEISG
jgi:replicative DNA helicase